MDRSACYPDLNIMYAKKIHSVHSIHPMHPIVAVSVAALFSLSLTACKKAPAPAAPAPVADSTPKPSDISRLTDAQLVQANQQDGLGLALRIAPKTYKVKDPITLHVLIEDFAAREPIASGLCGGFFLSYEDTATHDSGGGEISANPDCFAGEPYPDSIPFQKGKLKVLDLDLDATTHLSIPPGKYLVTLDWKAYPVGPPTIAERVPYSHLHSNAVPLIVK
jgi:hypothetical protein